MSITYAAKLGPWRTDLNSDVLGFREFRPRLLDFARGVKAVNSLGVLHEVVGRREFARLSNGANVRLVPDPGSVVPIDAYARDQFKFDTNEYNIQCSASAYLRESLHSVIPDHLLEPYKVEGSLFSRSAKYLIKQLDKQLGVLTEQDFDTIKAQIALPYMPNTPIRTILATEVLRNLSLLADNGQPMSAIESVRLIKGKFNPIVFEKCWDQYAISNGPIASQTPGSLVACIITFVEERLSSGKPLTDVALKTSAIESHSEFTAMRQQISDLTHQLKALSASQVKQKVTPFTFVEKQYCHTHGPLSDGKHNSKTCFQRGEKHDETATVKDHKGGREIRWRQ